jgi:hypothetical protein
MMASTPSQPDPGTDALEEAQCIQGQQGELTAKEWLSKPLGLDEPRDWEELPDTCKDEERGEALQLWRLVALRCNVLASGDPGTDDKAWRCWHYLRKWINFLLKPSAQTFYFQEALSEDTTFYKGEGTLQPKQRGEWPKELRQEILPWLRNPEQLTIVELELALTIFDRSAGAPKLAWWVSKKPYLLHKIHRFLLARYCFGLLGPLREARAAQDLNAPPNRAVEYERINPRLTGFMAVGTLAIVGLDFLPAFFFAGYYANIPVALLVALLFLVLKELAYMDVFKQNRPLLVTRRHAKSRTWHLLQATLWRSAGFAATMMGFWSVAERTILRPHNLERVFNTVHDPRSPSWNLGNLIWPYLRGPLETAWYLETWRLVTGFCALALSAAVLGFLLQGFWEDTSALEPI